MNEKPQGLLLETAASLGQFGPARAAFPRLALPWRLHLLILLIFFAGLVWLGRLRTRESTKREGQRRFVYSEAEFSSSFDDGNLGRVHRLSPGQFRAWMPGSDWVRFKIFAFTHTTIVFASTAHNDAKTIVLRKSNGVWSYLVKGRPHLTLSAGDVVEVASRFPFSFEDNDKLVDSVYRRLKRTKNVQAVLSVLSLSEKGRSIKALWLSTPSGKAKTRVPRLSEDIFPFNAKGGPLLCPKRPIVIVVARMRYNDTSSSFLMRGFLKRVTKDSSFSRRLLSQTSLVVIPFFAVDEAKVKTNVLRDLLRFFSENMRLFCVIELAGGGAGDRLEGPKLRSSLHFDQLLLPQFFDKLVRGKNMNVPGLVFGQRPTGSLSQMVEKWVSLPRVFTLRADFGFHADAAADCRRLEQLGSQLLEAVSSAVIFSRGVARRMLAPSFSRLFQQLSAAPQTHK